MTPVKRDAVAKPVFLSASEPDPKRRPEYWESRRLLNVREAVRALAAYMLPRQPLVFGGHPAITPLVDAIAGRIRHDAAGREATSPRVLRFLSEHFAARFPPDVVAIPDTVLTPSVDTKGEMMPPNSGDRAMSLLLMRYAMIGRPERPPVVERMGRYRDWFGQERRRRFGTTDFAAGIFIGGMEGVEREFNIFRHFHPTTPAWPIASTGSAAAHLLESLELPPELAAMLREDTVYSLVMEELLGREPTHVPRPAQPFREEDHLDPPGLG